MAPCWHAVRSPRVPQATAPPPPLRRFDDLPGPRGLPLVGNLLQIQPDRLHLQMAQWCREHGPVFKLKLGGRKAVVFGDHSLVQATLRDRPEGFRRTSRLREIVEEMGLQVGVFNATGDAWKRQRRMVMHGFDPGHVRRYMPSLQGVAPRLVQRWQAAADLQATDAQAAIDLQADLMRYTVDTIAGLAFGATVNTLQTDDDVIQRHLDTIFPAITRRVFAPLPLWRWFPSQADRDLQRNATMRLKPVAPMLPQQALRSSTVGGVQIDEGMIVFGLMRVDSVSDAHIPNAAQFDPQRWLGDGKPGQVASAARRTSMPFGAGPRICPGRYLALLEMKMAMAVLLQNFDIERVDTPDGQPPAEQLNFTMTPVGLRMRLKRRVMTPV